jgi:hypothetical protein
MIVFQRSLKFYIIYDGSNLTVLDGLSNDNEIVQNLKNYQLNVMYISISMCINIYELFLIFLYLLKDLIVKIVKGSLPLRYICSLHMQCMQEPHYYYLYIETE